MIELRSATTAGDEHCLNDVSRLCQAAADAFDAYRSVPHSQRSALLEAIAEEILALGDPLIETAMRESNLPRARLEGERGRTVAQLRMFAEVVRMGHWQQLRFDSALPDRAPLPRPDIRLRMIPLGPVAVFGASNFPLAFSTAGGDTASALAAGCPVVVKGHPAHPQTGAMVAAAITRAVEAQGLPAGVFGHLAGPGNELGAELVRNPHIAAVGFTGSRGGGLALLKIAQAREVPIPVYAEMSSINPVVILPAALANRAAALGEAFVASVTMGAGQFCTNPGLLLAIEGEGLDQFLDAAAQALASSPAQTMLTPGIAEAYQQGAALLRQSAGVEGVAQGIGGEANQCQAALFRTDAANFLASHNLGNEVFGAASILVSCQNATELEQVLADLEGQLTATLQMDADDTALASQLMPLLERKAGRILANGWPTGVEVCHAMVHGGPFPATSDARTTSVGSMAIDRFLRPVCYQNLDEKLLPFELQGENGPEGTTRLVDGRVHS